MSGSADPAEELPGITVVVPTYNRSASLRALLEVLAPIVAAEPMEVVVIDDGSTDATAALLADTPWIRHHTQPNAGAAAARNAGWRMARAELVAFIDDDCRPGAGWPLAFLDAFDEPDVGGVGGPIGGAGSGALVSFVEVERLVDHGRDGPDGVDYLVTANAAFRKEALEAVMGFDPTFPGAAGEDVDLSWRVRAAGWRLVRGGPAVEHDHRTTIREIVRTSAGHGRARVVLDQRHPDQSAKASAGRALAPAAWIERWHAYRGRGVGVVTTVGLLGLRLVSLGSYAVGLRRGRRR